MKTLVKPKKGGNFDLYRVKESLEQGGLAVAIGKKNELIVNFFSLIMLLKFCGTSILVKKLYINVFDDVINCRWMIRWYLFPIIILNCLGLFLYEFGGNEEDPYYWALLLLIILVIPLIFMLYIMLIKLYVHKTVRLS